MFEKSLFIAWIIVVVEAQTTQPENHEFSFTKQMDCHIELFLWGLIGE